MNFAPDDELTVRLSIAEWNTIMAILAKQPYELVEGLIAKLREQAEAAQRARRPHE